MSRIHVCPLSRVESTLATSGAASMVSLLALKERVPVCGSLAPGRHLHVALSDITVATDAHVLPDHAHVAAFLDFVRAWDRKAPMLIHCYAGVSRSTAAAFIALCALQPEIDETHHATRLRAASPMATPNPRLIALADEALGRSGRMASAIRAIGRGADCFEGVSFMLDLTPPLSPFARPA